MKRFNRRSLMKGSLMPLAGALGLPSISEAAQATASASRRPKLRITDVRTAEVQVHSYQVLVRIDTDQGISGLGECVDAATGAIPNIRAFGRQLIGQDPLNIEAFWERARTGGIFNGAQAGQFTCALTAVESALWDLAGKALGVPIWQLMGGRIRSQVRIYADAGARELRPNDDYSKNQMKRIVDMGFLATKTDLDDAGDPNRLDRVNWTATVGEVDRMIEQIRFLREGYPKNMNLAADMHGRYDLGTAKRVAKELEPFKLMWLEEPVPPGEVDAMADVRHSTSTPIACGENVYMRWGFRELLEKKAVDIIQPDFQKCGGLLEARKIADMAHTYYVPLAPHGVSSPIGMMGTAQVCSVIPNFLVQEWHWIDEMDSWTNWVQEGNIINKGVIAPTDAPGLGLTLNEEAAKRRQVPGTPWFEPLPNAGRGRGFSAPGGPGGPDGGRGAGGGRGGAAVAPAAGAPPAANAGGRQQ